jgi:hypothetical protein
VDDRPAGRTDGEVLAGFIRELRGPHHASADTTTAWTCLSGYLT